MAERSDQSPQRGRIDLRRDPGALAQGRRRLGQGRRAALRARDRQGQSVVPAPGSGVLKIGVAEGETVADRRDRRHDRPGRNARGRRRTAPAPATPAATAKGAGRGGSPGSAGRAGGRRAGDRPLSPAVRRLVAEQGVDVARVAATGPGGRVTKGDVLAYLESPQPASHRRPPATAPANASPGPLRRASQSDHDGGLARPASA